MSQLDKNDRDSIAKIIEQYGFSQLMSELEDYCYTKEHQAIARNDNKETRKWGDRRQYFASLINK